MRIILTALCASALAAACYPAADTDNPVVATEDAVVERMADAPSPGANSFTEEQARERILAAGYSDPTGLVQADDDGIWRGQATLAGQTVQVAVDYQGNVTRTPNAGAPSTANP
jgi:hypothetical protein